MGHELTAMFGIDHGLTLAVVLPALLEYTKTDKLDKLLQYGERVWGIKSGSDIDRADKVIHATRAFFEELGASTHLSDYGIGKEDIPRLVEKLKEHNFYNMGERKKINPEDMGKFLKCVYKWRNQNEQGNFKTGKGNNTYI